MPVLASSLIPSHRKALLLTLSLTLSSAGHTLELGDAQWRQWRKEGARAELQKASSARLTVSPLDGEAWAVQAELAMERLVSGQGDAAALESLADRMAPCAEARPVVPLCHLALSQIRSFQGTLGGLGALRRVSQAMAHARLAAEAAPALYEAQSLLLNFYRGAPGWLGGSPEKADAHMQWLAARQPAMLPLLRAEQQLGLGQLDQASAVLSLSVSTLPAGWREGHSVLLAHLGREALKAQRWDLLKSCVQRLQADHPEDASGAYLQGRLMAGQDQAWTEALQAYQRARALKGADPLLLDLHSAKALAGLGRKGQAKALLQQVLDSSSAAKAHRDEARRQLAVL